jgi:GAF domain-containing protein
VTDEQLWDRDRDRFSVSIAPVGPDRPTTVDSGLPDWSPLARQFSGLTRALLDVTTVAEALQHVIDAAVEFMPGVDLASVTLRSPNGTFHTPVDTDPLAVELDQLQYETGEGPCVDSARPTGPASAYSGNLASGSPWPRFGPGAASRGVAAVLSTALLPDAQLPQLSGALNLYSRQRGSFSTADRDTALLLATHASLALATTRAVTAGDLRAQHMKKALDSRDIIGQAKGVLMQRRGITADEAFDILRRASQELNVKLADLATTLTSRHTEIDRLQRGQSPLRRRDDRPIGS